MMQQDGQSVSEKNVSQIVCQVKVVYTEYKANLWLSDYLHTALNTAMALLPASN